MGLELARRLGEPTVVFVPTTTIQQQWHDEVRLLLPAARDLSTFVSTDVHRLAPITVLTYQVLSTTADPDRELVELARRQWADELVRSNRFTDDATALRYLEGLESSVFRREARTRIRTLRRQLLAHGEINVHRFLHDNARRLVDRIVDAGVATVILDECHHLLDHWAVVLADLIDRLEERRTGQVHAIGLTATLPSPSSAAEQHNYELLLGEIDAEIPTPAVVKDGALAPYRDLAVFVEPTQDEQRFLDSIARRFDQTVVEVAADDSFLAWLTRQAGAAAVDQSHTHGADGDAGLEGCLDAWARWLRADPAMAVAVLRAHQRFGLALPAGMPIPAAATEPFGTDDWLIVLERWMTGVLMLSDDDSDRRRLGDLRDALGGFGITVTTRGVRHGRPPGDVVLALSDGKAQACAEVLGWEHDALGERTRALVVTDVDRMVTAAARLRGVLDADAGSGRRLHRHLVEAAGSRRLDPVLVTGTTVRAGNVVADTLADELNVWLARRNVAASCRAEPVDDRVQELVGEGPEWTAQQYVSGITALFAEGLTRCVVGTRGVFGEGWDAPACNVLVDLTAVTTATAQQQLRGRVLRLDTHWPEKVAHRWDVVCIAPAVPGGGTDLARFVRRHAVLWGICLEGDTGDPAQIVRGVRHVDARLADLLTFRTGTVDLPALAEVTDRSQAAVSARHATRAAWGIGTSTFRGAVTTPTQIRPATGVHVDAARRRPEPAAVATGAGAAATSTAAVAATSVDPTWVWVTVALAAGTAAAAWWWRRRRMHRLARTLSGMLNGQIATSDLVALLATLGDALRLSLVDAGVLHAGAADARVTVLPGRRTLSVELEPGPHELLASDHHHFATAFRQLLGPINDPRYVLILRHGRQRLALPVPDELGRNRDRAEALAAHLRWREHDVDVLYTRSDDGARLLTQLWTQQRLPLHVDAFDRWA